MKKWEEILPILVCPKTKRPLKQVERSLLEEINGRISQGEVFTIGGEKVEDPIEEALIEEKGGVLYPVKEGIPVLIYEEGILFR